MNESLKEYAEKLGYKLRTCQKFSKAVMYYQFILLGGNSQNFLSKFLRLFVTLGLKILRLLRLKVVFEVDINKKS